MIDDFTTRTLNLNRRDNVAEMSAGRPVERIEVGNWSGAENPGRFAAALRR